ncbi:hypothetical protein AB0K93_25255 [Streptomyces sp. NPDC052676]|uniref:hypothetical protein n=1 Tax=Streptomyces sp. NPDC052676 TaxID=3154953 RepID=UPI0034175899
MDRAGHAEISALPFVDVHTVLVDAEPAVVWRAAGEAVTRSFAGGPSEGVARLLGAADPAASGARPPAPGATVPGATVPGFRVVTADEGRTLALAGSHRFSAYALVLRLEREGPGRTRLRAETRAAFPGPAGRLYKLLVIGSRAHRLVVRRMLARIRRRAEAGGPGSGRGAGGEAPQQR